MSLSVIGYIVGVVGLICTAVSAAFALSCYRHLRQWALECKSVRVAIAYKGKVKLEPTLEELMLWARKVPKDRTGQPFFGMGGVRIAIIRRVKVPRQRKRNQQSDQNGAPVREGTWSARDDTVKSAS